MRIAWPEFAGTRDIDYHPLFRGYLSRSVWRFYTHALTPTGLWFAGLTTLLGFVAISGSLDLPLFIPFCYASGIWAGAFFYMLVFPPRVHIQAAHANRVGVDEILPVDVEIQQLRRWAPPLCIVPHGLHPAMDPVPPKGVDFPLLGREERSRARLGLRCKKRGLFRLKGFRVQSDFPYGILHAYRIYPLESSLLVYPRFTSLSHFQLPVGRRYQPGGIAFASSLGDSFELIGTREYREGDNPRDIDWRATGRLNKPVVREYREEYFLRVAVILDTHIPDVGRDALGRVRSSPTSRSLKEAFERAVSLTAAVSDKMARDDYLVDLFAAGPNLYHLTAGRSIAYLDQILDILACVEESPIAPFATIEPELFDHLAQVTAVVCLLLDWDETRRAFIQRIQDSGAAVKVIFVRDEPFTLDPNFDDALLGRSRFITREEFDQGIQEI